MADAHSIARLATLAHTGLADHALLARFASERDEFAFAALVERHGPVVLDVARSVLRHTQDAEDVFQASFLVLARNANTIRTRASVGCWLHGVARRLALRARRARTRRARYEAVPRDAPIPDDELTWAEVRALIHAELARLPEALRAPILLCHLEGLTLDEAAARLELSRSTLRRHLDRAREVLRVRLARRGLAVAAIAFPTSISNAVPPEVVLGTARSAVRFAAGFADPTRAVELANGAMSAMTAVRMKLGLLLVATLSTVGLVVAGTQMGTGPQKAELPSAPAPTAKPEEKPPAKSMTDEEKLQGAWAITNDVFLQAGEKWTFISGRLERPGEKKAPKPEDQVNTWYKLDPKQNPKTIDLTCQVGTDGPLVFVEKGIYSLEGNELRLCMAAGGAERPKLFSKDLGRTSLLTLTREPPAKAIFLDQREGKPPMRTVFVSLELTNPRNEPVWLLTRYSGDKPLAESGKFLATEDTPQAFVGDSYRSTKDGGMGEAVRVSFIGGFHAFYLAPEATVRFDRYPIECWKDVDQIEVWEVSALRVNGRTALDEWLPYRTKSDVNVRVPAGTPATNLDWDARTAKSRTDYPKERVEFVRAEPIRKWLLPIKKPGAKAPAPKTPLEELQGTWDPIALEAPGSRITGPNLSLFLRELVIANDTFRQDMVSGVRLMNIRVYSNTSPKSFDLFAPPDNSPDVETEKKNLKPITLGIYDLTGDTLTLAFSGNDVRPTGFKVTADSKATVCTYRRRPPAKSEKAPAEYVSAEATLYLGRDGLGGKPGEVMKKAITDEETLAKLAACFPELGSGKTSSTAGAWKAAVTFQFTNRKGELIKVYSNWTEWNQGKGDWPVKASLMKLTGELFEQPVLIDRGTIAGEWEFVKAEQGGKKQEPPPFDLVATGSTLRFETNGKFLTESEWKVNYTIDPSKSPKEIDFVFSPRPTGAKTARGIYAVKDDTLMICLGGGQNRPADFNALRGPDDTLWVLKRKGTGPAPAPAPAAGDLDGLRKKLRSGTPEEKRQALTTIRDLQAIRLIPDVIEAVADPTALPREGDTGWGFVGHQAATVMVELARAVDGTDRAGRRDYTFHDDQYKGGEKLKELGRLEDVRKNWARWHADRK
ncbi:sigma-70 family RNA polymerase sigma factor [Gemmata sp. G18]|uniref:Sigma-70 family RNA polymerase sigma factor n=1 Tax=Gemmata palustris TaxID=2822762 RepID=A0ABS5BRR8_9BACT|nr:sigma-70 family RNA polymerase sigma factor [Gemmata palustris]MBP3956351.1 sigma-70 family RNA polymerase sigma factor [Gemmata palustris]